MKNRTVIVGAALVAAAFAVAAGQQVTLKRVPKVGDTANYSMKIDLVVQGTQVNVSYDAVQKVTVVNPDGSFVISEQNKNQVVLVAGSEMPGGAEETSTMTYAVSGRITKIESASSMGDEQRLANLTVLVWPDKPVDVGSKWTSKTPADKDKGTFDTEYAFEVLAREKLLGYDTFKISSVIKESGGDATCNSTTWVDVKTGQTIKATGEMKNVPIQGMPMDAKFVLEMKK